MRGFNSVGEGVFLVSSEEKSSMGGEEILCQEYHILCDFDNIFVPLDRAPALHTMCVETN